MSPYCHILDGYKVLDLTQFVAGPTVTRLLAEMGAEVIKVELAPGGDPMRTMYVFKDGRSSLFVQHNRGKQSLCLDGKSAAGRAILTDLARAVDVVVENFTPGAIARLGLGYDTVSRINPRIIMCSISGFGQSGLLADKPGFDTLGASYLACKIAAEAVFRNRQTVAFFSLEMGLNAIRLRILCAEARVSQYAIRRGTISNEELHRLGQKAGEYAAAPLWIDPTSSLSALDVRARSRKLARTHGLGLVVVDYLGIMRVEGTGRTRTEDVGQISGRERLPDTFGVCDINNRRIILHNGRLPVAPSDPLLPTVRGVLSYTK